MKTPETLAFERAIRPVLRPLLQEKRSLLEDFRPDPTLQDRIEVLASKCTEGQLTPAERSEYEGYVRANKFIATLRRQVRSLEEAVS